MPYRMSGYWLIAVTIVASLTMPIPASAAPALRPDMIRSLEGMQQRLASGDDDVAGDAQSAAERLEGGNAADRWARTLFLKLAATALARQGEYIRAADLFATARSIEGIDAEQRHRWLNQEARLRLSAGQTQAGVELLARWLELGQGEAEDFWLQAQALATLQRWSQAADWIDRARQASASPNTRQMQLAASVYQRAGREDAALDVLDGLLAGDGDDPDVWRRAAGLAQRLDQPGRAAAIWEAAWRRGVLTSDADLLQLIRLHIAGGTPARGGEYLAEALASDRLDDSLENARLLAEAWSAARQRDKAIKAWREVAKRSGRAEDWQRLGELAYGWGRWRVAAEALSQASEAGGDVARNGLLEGVAYIELGKRQAARRALEAARQAGSKRAEAWLSMLEDGADNRDDSNASRG
ncbi:hypothetical protein SAMN05661010_02375 [Modicisalibacter muralis]|uniref:Tetratricopeptide repeat-containing protein n=1 Tax=Modicisalibacter muralis TaxID=119000 RepID=A0A1G9MAT9_9GAMM|nr:hypothetical protein [Halomonas muralis]SDL71047.1 hypothetical protein SAMN05661010_02375 [Halomonas muralis]